MLDKITESPFSLHYIFEAIRIEKYFSERGITLADIATVKEQLMQVPVQQAQTLPKTVKPAKTDTSVKKYEGALRCPKCDGRLFRENVCPGCAEGKTGKKIRFTCENYPQCDYEEAL